MFFYLHWGKKIFLWFCSKLLRILKWSFTFDLDRGKNTALDTVSRAFMRKCIGFYQHTYFDVVTLQCNSILCWIASFLKPVLETHNFFTAWCVFDWSVIRSISTCWNASYRKYTFVTTKNSSLFLPQDKKWVLNHEDVTLGELLGKVSNQVS